MIEMNCSLVSDFSATLLHTLLIDMNPAISHIPVSLAPLSWWGVLGVEGCPVHVKEENLSFLKPLNTCGHVPPLIELAARFIHNLLKSKALPTVLQEVSAYSFVCSEVNRQ